MKKILEKTRNRGEFNRVYKKHLESSGKIRCAHCKYHDGENFNCDVYGGLVDAGLVVNVETEEELIHNVSTKIKHPNWKLVSKNKKQWMDTNKSYYFNKLNYRYDNRIFIKIKW